MQVTSPPRLLIAAHGTESATGSATTATLVGAVAAAAREVPVSLCFLDVVGPSLADALGAADGPTVVVPLLLSTGYHVQSDIPAVVGDRPGVRIAAHLGPDPLIISALADRLGAAAAVSTASTVLVGVGSSRPEARPELESAGRQLAERLGRPVVAMTLFEDVRGTLTAQPQPVDVATYLLAEGEFYTRLCAAADGLAPVTAPIGAHPELVRLVLARYRAALAENAPRTVR